MAPQQSSPWPRCFLDAYRRGAGRNPISLLDIQTAVNGSWSAWKEHGQPPDAEQLGLELGMNKNGRLDLLAGVSTPGAETQQFHTCGLPQTTPNGS